MSFTAELAAAVENTPFTKLASLSQTVWQAWGAGHIDDTQAQAFADRIAERRKAFQPESVTAFRKPTTAAAKPSQRSPDKQRSIERRRRLARCSPVPSDLVHLFTQGELAVVTTIAGEIARKGACDWCLARIAAITGVCKGVVRSAVKKARAYGLWFSVERRRAGQVSLTNVVRALSKPWGAFLRRWVGFRKKDSTTLEDTQNGPSKPVDSPKEAFENGLVAPDTVRNNVPGGG
jgi:hypothetical protein